MNRPAIEAVWISSPSCCARMNGSATVTQTNYRQTALPGVALAVREVPKRVGLARGLDTLMGLQ